MIKGWITGPEGLEKELKELGFSVLYSQYSKLEIRHLTRNEELYDYKVQGPNSSLDKIDDMWGDWIWSLINVGEN